MSPHNSASIPRGVREIKKSVSLLLGVKTSKHKP